MSAAEVTALATRQDYSREQIELIKNTICVGATDNELSLFVQTAKRMQLDPFARQIFAVKRWNRQAGREVMSTQVSIDGFRLVAERTGKYAGQLGPFWTADGKDWVDVWLAKEPPRAAKVAVLRHDFKEPVWAVATWDEYKQEGKNGLSPMWAKMGALMLAKCAESLGLRRAFPNELSGIYSDAEMAQATTVEVVEPTDHETNETIRGALGEAPKAAPSAAPKATAATTSRPPRANTVKHDGTFASHKQVALLHMLKSKVGGMSDDMYRKQLGGFKDCDGKPITTSKDLSEAQISNLIDRYEAKIKQQEARAAELPDLGAIDAATEKQIDELSMAIAGVEDSEKCAELICDTFKVMTIADLQTKDRVSGALAIAMAFGTKALEPLLAKIRA